MRHLLKQRCNIEVCEQTVGEDHELKNTWTVSDSDVPCLVQIKRGDTLKTIAGQSPVFDAVGYFLSDVELTPSSDDSSKGSRIVLGNSVYYVKGVDATPAGIGGHVRAFLRKD